MLRSYIKKGFLTIISVGKVGKVTATDADKDENADVTYSLLTEWGNEVFSLNPASGIFTLTSSLDYEKTEHYMFVVSGTDHGEPQLSSTVTVYINVKVLYFFSYHFHEMCTYVHIYWHTMFRVLLSPCSQY